jgi:hypothetical protein
LKHLSENIIEQYILKSPDIDLEQNNIIERHLTKCSSCSAVYDLLLSFYKDFNEYISASSRTQDRLDSFVATQYPVLPLMPLHVPGIYPAGYTTVLAALTPTQDYGRFKTIVTLASEKEQALVRIIHDVETNKYKFYVLTEDLGRKSYAILSFPEIAADFVTDERGQLEIDIKPADSGKSWTFRRGILRLLVAEVELSVTELVQTNILKATKEGLYSLTVRISHGDFSLTVQALKSYAPLLTLAVVDDGTGTVQFMPLRNGNGTCVVSGNLSNIKIRFFC